MNHLKTLTSLMQSLENPNFQKYWSLKSCQTYERAYRAVQINNEKRLVVFDKNQENIETYQIFEDSLLRYTQIDYQTYNHILESLSLTENLNNLEKLTLFVKTLHTNFQTKDNPAFHEKIINLFIDENLTKNFKQEIPNFIEIIIEQDYAEYKSKTLSTLPLYKTEIGQLFKRDPLLLQLPEISRFCYNYNTLTQKEKTGALLIYDQAKHMPKLTPLINIFHKNWQDVDQKKFKKFIFNGLEKLSPTLSKTKVLDLCRDCVQKQKIEKQNNLFVGLLRKNEFHQKYLVFRQFEISLKSTKISTKDIILTEQNLYKNLW